MGLLIFIIVMFSLAGCIPTSESGDWRHKYETLELENNHLKGRLGILESELSQVHAANKKLQVDYDKLTADYDALTLSYNILKTNYDALKALLGNLSNELAEINNTPLTSDNNEIQSEQPVPPIGSPTPADFTVTNFSILRIDIDDQEEAATISATITNSGGSSGNYTAILKINGYQVETKSVTLNAGESQVVGFMVVDASPGNYAVVELGGLIGTLKFARPEPPLLKIISLADPTEQGYTATLRARTEPGAYCTITVIYDYESGPSEALGLDPQEADNEGYVAWAWKVGTRTTPGRWPIVVTASLGGATVSQTTFFTVY